MKKLLLASLLLGFMTIGQPIHAQTKEKNLSQAEEFSASAGKLIEKTFVEVGKVKGVEVNMLKLKDLISGQEINALRLTYEYKSSYSSDTKIASLDKDELDGLIKSLKIIIESVLITTKENYTEVAFRSRTGFETGCYYSTNKSKWSAYMQLEKYDSNSFVIMTTEHLSELLSLVEKAKSMM